MGVKELTIEEEKIYDKFFGVKRGRESNKNNTNNKGEN